ncbi:MAG: sulfotransferase domain-containing protein [Brumimicrobium sp.]|nr:sulfotransferase domain-containing protein [Brumimicrobium sp.]
MQRRVLKFLIKLLNKIAYNVVTAKNHLNRYLYYMDFQMRDDDIYIVTYMKSGTTWMQVIVYNLLTEGNMDFNHIYDVSPWPSNQAAKGETAGNINAIPSPRILKFHDHYKDFDPSLKNKIIYVFRDGKDVAVSYFHHNKNYVNAELTFDENFEKYFNNPKNKMNYFSFNKDWFDNKYNLNILYISYESLKTDFDNTLKRIADFLNVKLTDDIVKRTKIHSSFQYMKEHEEKFGEVPPSSKLVYNQFIRKGEIGGWRNYFSDKQLKEYQENYDKLLGGFLE